MKNKFDMDCPECGRPCEGAVGELEVVGIKLVHHSISCSDCGYQFRGIYRFGHVKPCAFKEWKEARPLKRV